MEPVDVFDFDEWAALAERDPAAFEARRRALIKSHIDAIPDAQAHVRDGLTAALLGPRPADGTGLEHAVAAYNLMQDSLVRLLDAYGALAKELALPCAQKPLLSAAQRFTRFALE